MNVKYKRILLKLSGESLMGEKGFGIDENRLASYARQIKEVSDSGAEIGIVIGGGNIFRGLSGTSKGFDRVRGDQMGMLATVINSLALQSALTAIGKEAQLLTALADGSYPVVLSDTGDADDMHPSDKRIVGKRLAELTLGLRNQDRARACGPVPTGITRDDDKLVITFDLPVAWRDDKPYGWVVAGVDGIFHSASAQITGEARIEVSSPEVAVPVEVRYGWSINPMQANLTGNNGLPASPFRLRSRE